MHKHTFIITTKHRVAHTCHKTCFYMQNHQIIIIQCTDLWTGDIWANHLHSAACLKKASGWVGCCFSMNDQVVSGFNHNIHLWLQVDFFTDHPHWKGLTKTISLGCCTRQNNWPSLLAKKISPRQQVSATWVYLMPFDVPSVDDIQLAKLPNLSCLVIPRHQHNCPHHAIWYL